MVYKMASELIKSLFEELERRVSPETERFIVSLDGVMINGEFHLQSDQSTHKELVSLKKEALLTALKKGYTNLLEIIHHYEMKVELYKAMLEMEDITPEENKAYSRNRGIAENVINYLHFYHNPSP